MSIDSLKLPTKIVGPNETMVPAFGIGGAAFPVVADLPDGGWLQIIPGLNPLDQAIPGVRLQPGSMLAVVPPEVAVHFRPAIRDVEAKLLPVNPFRT